MICSSIICLKIIPADPFDFSGYTAIIKKTIKLVRPFSACYGFPNHDFKVPTNVRPETLNGRRHE